MDPEATDTDATSANDAGGVGDTLRPSEALDSDNVRNVDGDEVVDPPEDWRAANEPVDGDESMDEKLAAERPEPSATEGSGDTEPRGQVEELPDDQLDRLTPEEPGTDAGQVSGTPEDGDSYFPVVD